MPCYNPLKAYRSRIVNPFTGKRSMVFSHTKALGFGLLKPIELPCGQCIGCRLEKSRQWAIRCMHEAETHEANCFITLTYKPSCLPEFGSIDKNAPVLFMKRLRKKYGSKIRSFGCAEYGEKKGRPHYHICLFNFDFPDKERVKDKFGVPISRNGFPVWVSESLAELWPYGRHEIGGLSFDSAAYVARYVTKKINGEQAKTHYQTVDEHGEIVRLEPERSICVSRRPGIGKKWLEIFKKGVRENDSVIIPRGNKNVEAKPPKYYDRQWELEDPEEFEKAKQKRISKARRRALIETRKPEEVRAIQEYLQLEKMQKLNRRYEENGE